MRNVWNHSTQVAATATILCKHYTRLKPDQATLAGLVHQIGILPLLSFAEMRPELLRNSFTLTATIEHLHPQIGEMILRLWEFPPELIAVPQEHSQLDRVVPQADYVDLVMIANLESLYGTEHPLAQVDWHDVSAFKRLGLEPDELTSNKELIEEKTSAVNALN